MGLTAAKDEHESLNTRPLSAALAPPRDVRTARVCSDMHSHSVAPGPGVPRVASVRLRTKECTHAHIKGLGQKHSAGTS